MTKFFIVLSVLFVGLMMWNDFQGMQCPFPQFTVEEMHQICLEEEIY